MDIIEHFVRRYARRTTRNGEPVIITNGDGLFKAAFKHLGWDDPHPEHQKSVPVVEIAATVEAPEKAVLPKPKGRFFR